MLLKLFETFEAHELVESGFHQYLYEGIKKEQVSNMFKIISTFFLSR